jgi:ABC-2 type transport system permease protein
MRKYLKMMNIGIQMNFIYRYNFIIQTVSQFAPLITTVILWNAIFLSTSHATVGGYSQTNMICYFLLENLVALVTGLWFQDYEITGEIRSGQINQFLLRPVNYLVYRWVLVLAKKMIYMAFTIIPILIGYYFLRDYLVPPKDTLTLILVIVSTFLALFLNTLLSFCAGLIGFWLLEVSSLFFIFYILQFLLCGGSFPLDLLPKPIFYIMNWLPFQYIGFFQVKLYLGAYTPIEAWQGLMKMVLWIVLTFLLAQFLWSRGTRRYSAYGG